MNSCRWPVLLFVALTAVGAAEPPPTAEGIIAWDGGDAPLTARLTKFPYRRHRRDAAHKKQDGLRQLFRFTTSESFVGSGAESHCSVLRDLLLVWGDAAYARVLATESPKVRRAVIAGLDYTWPYPGWKPSQYPVTYRLAKHEGIASSP